MLAQITRRAGDNGNSCMSQYLINMLDVWPSKSWQNFSFEKESHWESLDFDKGRARSIHTLFLPKYT